MSNHYAMTTSYPSATAAQAAANARNHIAAVRASEELLEALIDPDRPAGFGVEHADVKRLNARIGIALKLADVEATLAVAAAVEELGRRLASECSHPHTTAARGLDALIPSTLSGR